MNNRELAKIFYEMADYLEMQGIAFRPYAYRKAAQNLEGLQEDAAKIYQEGGLKGLEEIPGIGKNLALRIEEYLKTGKIRYYEQFKKKIPVKLGELIAVEGLGPRRTKALYEELKIKDLKDLETAARAHKIAPLFGFGKKTEENILQGIEFLKKSKGRFLLGDILPKIREIEERLRNLKEVKKLDIAGSLRRKKETIGDADFLAVSRQPEKIMDFFVSLPGVVKIWGKGKTKASIRLKEGFDIDLRVVPQKSYGAALQYFTGSKEHNIALRRIAVQKSLKLSEYGLFKGSKMIAGESEEEIYKILGLKWIAPEMRENQGEIELALRSAQVFDSEFQTRGGKLPGLPKLIEYKDIKGDLHCHSNWDGGENSIKEMAEEAQKMGYQYIGIADHTKFLRIEKGLDEKELLSQRGEIDKLNTKYKIHNARFKALHGCEANILRDGSIDISDKVLAKLDYVIAGIHSSMKMEKRAMTERMLRAMKNPHVDIISHPTGRLLQKRDEYQIDFDAILNTAKETGTILEINSSPERLDLNAKNIHRAKEMGIKMVINTDSHHKNQLQLMEFGVFQARRGWAEKKDIINCLPVEKLLETLKKKD